MKNGLKKVQYSKLIVSSVVLLYFLLIPYSLVYIWRFEASTVLITILTTVGGVLAVVCNGYMNKSRFENVLKIQKSLDKSSPTTKTVTEEIRATIKDEIKNALREDITKFDLENPTDQKSKEPHQE